MSGITESARGGGDAGGLVELVGQRLEVADQDEHRERDGDGEVRDDERGETVEQAQVADEQEERHDERDIGDHARGEDAVVPRVDGLAELSQPPAAESQAEEVRKTGQVVAIALLVLIFAMIAHKGYHDISRIAEKHSGKEFWVEMARYAIGNLAGGARKQE